MIWLTITRIGSLMTMGAAVKHYYDQYTREVKSHRIYTSSEVARFLGVSRRAVVKLVKNGAIPGKMANGNFRISGQSILDYMNK